MAIGRYFTDAINQSITNERMSMRDRFSQEIQQRRFDEANAYRDKGFMENVRQFQLGHALRQAADSRAETADKRAGERHRFLYDPETGYMYDKADREKESHGWAGDRHRWAGDQHKWAGEQHKFLYDPETGYMYDKADREKESHGWAGDRHRWAGDQHKWAGERHQDARDQHKFMYGDDGYMQEKREQEQTQHNYLFGDDGIRSMEKELLEKKIDDYGKLSPLEQSLIDYRNAMIDYYEKLGLRGSGGGGDDKSLIGTPGQSVSSTDDILNREMFPYATELNELLEHEDSNWWDLGKIAATTGVGAGLGSIIPGIGTLIGSGIGGGIGLITGLILSNDPLMSKEEALTTFSSVGMRIRNQLKRENPGATDAEINKRMLANWNAMLNAHTGTGSNVDTTIGDRLREKIRRSSGGGMEAIYAQEALRQSFISGTMPNAKQTAPTEIEDAVRQQWEKTHPGTGPGTDSNKTFVR